MTDSPVRARKRKRIKTRKRCAQAGMTLRSRHAQAGMTLRSRHAQEGMTLIEIMIVMVIMALIAAGAGFAIVPQLTKAKIKNTQADAKTIGNAAIMYLTENKDCPNVQKLVDQKILDKKNRTKDAWDNEYTIECDEDGPVVRSAGPDGQMGNDDDIE